MLIVEFDLMELGYKYHAPVQLPLKLDAVLVDVYALLANESVNHDFESSPSDMEGNES
jgi:hypothetical protein